MIFVASSVGCINCANFKSYIQNNKQMIEWYAKSRCLLAHIYSGSGWFTSGDLRVFVYKIEGGTSTGLPTIGVWKNEKIAWQQTGYSTS